MSKRKIILCFTIIFIVKMIQISLLSDLRKCENHQGLDTIFAIHSGDTHSYIGAMENYIKHGEYYFFNGVENVSAGRLPHYSIPYFLFRQFASVEVASDLVVLLQVLIESIAIIFIALLSYRLINSEIAFYVTIGLLGGSLLWTNFSNYLSPESTSISFFYIGLYFFYEYARDQKVKYIFFCGLFFALVGLLKPYLLPIFLIPGVYFIWKFGLRSISSWTQTFKLTVIASLPLILLLVPWVIRNYQVYNRFIPLQINLTAGYDYSEAELAIRKYIGAWGDRFLFWDANSAGCFFNAREGFPCDFKLPDFIQTDKYSHKEIIEVRDLYLKSKAKKELHDEALVRINDMTADFKKENPLYYHVFAPLKLTGKFVGHSGAYYFPTTTGSICFKPFHQLIKISQALLYWAALIFGSIGILLMIRKNKNMYPSLFLIAYLILLFPIILRGVEWRMFHITYPSMVIGLIYLVITGTHKIKSNITISKKRI